MKQSKLDNWIKRPITPSAFDGDKKAHFIMDEVGQWNSTTQIRTLHINLKKKWFDMIAAGIKKEEYRAIKSHWDARLVFGYGFDAAGPASQHRPFVPIFREYETVSANNGYRKNGLNVTWKHIGIRIGTPNPDWCEPEDVGSRVYILDIGELISYRNYEGVTSYGEYIKLFDDAEK